MAIMEVTTKYGKVRGVRSDIPSITVFRGVPYAKPPVGENRWKEPEEPQAWDGVYDAGHFRPMAVQPPVKSDLDMREFCGFGKYAEMSEDCLYLNIWTPTENREEKLPVLVYIHGGGFIQGYSYDVTVNGDTFAKRGCVFVSVEYRLGIFGFLSLPELTQESPHSSSGNYGLLDQAAALKWIHENISAFGGNPENVTLWGQSAGSISTCLQMCSPLTEGLIHHVYMESGGGYTGGKPLMSVTMPLKEAERFGASVMEEMGVRTLEEARNVTAEELLAFESRYGMLEFLPVVDGYFLPEDPDEIIRKGKYHNIPILSGFCADEAGWFRGDSKASSPDGSAARAFAEKIKMMAGSYAEEYLKAAHYDEDPDAANDNSFHDGLTFPIIAFWECSASLPERAPVYAYHFERALPGDHFGAFHAGDLWYVFNTFERSWRPFTGEDFELGGKIAEYVCNFVKTGNPNGAGLADWTPYSSGNRFAMLLDSVCKMSEYPGTESSKVLVRMAMS